MWWRTLAITGSLINLAGFAVFELGKDIVRTTLPILEARSSKETIYQDEEVRKSGKGN